MDSSHFSPEPRATGIRLPRPGAAHPASHAAGSTEASQPVWGQMCCQKSRPAAEAQALEKRSRERREWLRCTGLIWAKLDPECRASATILWSLPEISRVLVGCN